MKKIIFILSNFGYFLASSAQRYTGYGRGLDRDGGFVFVTGDDAVSGIIMLLGCIITAFICYKLVNSIDRDEENKGVRKVIVYLLYVVITVSSIAAIGFAFALWWIVLIGVVICAIGAAIYGRMTEEDSPKAGKDSKNEYNKLTPLTIFENFHGALEVGCVVNDYNGDYFDICRCTNNRGSKLYIGYSSYLGKISYNEVVRMKNKLYIRCDDNACNFLCTEESEERRKADSDMKSQQRHSIEYSNMLSVLKQLNVEGKDKDYTFTNEKDF